MCARSRTPLPLPGPGRTDEQCQLQRAADRRSSTSTPRLRCAEKRISDLAALRSDLLFEIQILWPPRRV
jgi:hypothetical protein